MRLLLLICMIVLTPLRTWAGDSMVVQMAMGSADAVSSLSGATHADCLEHRRMQSTHVDGEPASPAHQEGGHCATCASCQLCFSAALVVLMPGNPAIALSHGLPRTNGVPYANAVLALGQKPPIS